MKWQELDTRAQRKAIILAAAVAAALLVLIWPAGVSRLRSPARPQPQKPSPMSKPVPVVHAAAPMVPAPPADPSGKLLGKWEGREALTDRGVCLLSLELRPGNDRQSFSGFSTFACTGNTLPGNSKDPVGMGGMMRQAMNYTSASFSGTAAEGGGILLHATDNIGVSEAQGCPMVSMTLKPFGDSRMSVRWQETGKSVCTGGEMLLAHAH